MVAIARGLMACPTRTILDGPSAALLQSTEVKRIFLGSSRGDFGTPSGSACYDERQ
jgi:hypothetical protein